METIRERERGREGGREREGERERGRVGEHSGYPSKLDRGTADSVVQVYFLGAFMVVHFRHQFVLGHFSCTGLASIRLRCLVAIDSPLVLSVPSRLDKS